MKKLIHCAPELVHFLFRICSGSMLMLMHLWIVNLCGSREQFSRRQMVTLWIYHRPYHRLIEFPTPDSASSHLFIMRLPIYRFMIGTSWVVLGCPDSEHFAWLCCSITQQNVAAKGIQQHFAVLLHAAVCLHVCEYCLAADWICGFMVITCRLCAINWLLMRMCDHHSSLIEIIETILQLVCLWSISISLPWRS